MRKRQASSSAQVPGPSGTEPKQTGRRTSVQIPVRRKAGRKSARCHRRRQGFGPEPSGRTELRPGSCETGRPRMQVHGLPGRPEASAKGKPAGTRNRCFGGGSAGQQDLGPRFRNCQAANRQGFGPDGEPAGKPKGAQALEGPRRIADRAPGSAHETRNRPSGLPRLPGLVSNRYGTVGAGGNVSPHFCWAPGPLDRVGRLV